MVGVCDLTYLLTEQCEYVLSGGQPSARHQYRCATSAPDPVSSFPEEDVQIPLCFTGREKIAFLPSTLIYDSRVLGHRLTHGLGLGYHDGERDFWSSPKPVPHHGPCQWQGKATGPGAACSGQDFGVPMTPLDWSEQRPRVGWPWAALPPVLLSGADNCQNHLGTNLPAVDPGTRAVAKPNPSVRIIHPPPDAPVVTLGTQALLCC